MQVRRYTVTFQRVQEAECAVLAPSAAEARREARETFMERDGAWLTVDSLAIVDEKAEEE